MGESLHFDQVLHQLLAENNEARWAAEVTMCPNECGLSCVGVAAHSPHVATVAPRFHCTRCFDITYVTLAEKS